MHKQALISITMSKNFKTPQWLFDWCTTAWKMSQHERELCGKQRKLNCTGSNRENRTIVIACENKGSIVCTSSADAVQMQCNKPFYSCALKEVCCDLDPTVQFVFIATSFTCNNHHHLLSFCTFDEVDDAGSACCKIELKPLHVALLSRTAPEAHSGVVSIHVPRWSFLLLLSRLWHSTRTSDATER